MFQNWNSHVKSICKSRWKDDSNIMMQKNLRWDIEFWPFIIFIYCIYYLPSPKTYPLFPKCHHWMPNQHEASSSSRKRPDAHNGFRDGSKWSSEAEDDMASDLYYPAALHVPLEARTGPREVCKAVVVWAESEWKWSAGWSSWLLATWSTRRPLLLPLTHSPPLRSRSPEFCSAIAQ